MGQLILLISIFWVSHANADGFTYDFDLRSFPGQLKKLSLRLKRNGNTVLAKVHSQSRDGTYLSGSFECQKRSRFEYHCFRNDGGGFFDLTATHQPKLYFRFFSMAEEGSVDSAFVKSEKGATVSGSRRR